MKNEERRIALSNSPLVHSSFFILLFFLESRDPYMQNLLGKTLSRLTHWLERKSAPAALAGSQWSGTQFTDAYKRNRAPTPNEQLGELKNTAFTCASINAAVCAAY